jgi:hypothetical protein
MVSPLTGFGNIALSRRLAEKPPAGEGAVVEK